MVYHWSLSDCKFFQVSRTLLIILADVNYAVVLMVSICPLISESSVPCTNHLVTVPKSPITISITIFFSFLLQGPSTYLSIRYLSDQYLLLLFTPQEFFTSVLADGFSLEFE